MEEFDINTINQWPTVASSVGLLLLGGLITLATTWFVTRQSHRHAERMRDLDFKEASAMLAQEGFVKLLQLANAAFSIQGAVVSQLSSSDINEEELLAVQKVQEIIAVGADLESLRSKEIAFLLHSNDAELLGDMLVFEKRVYSLQSAMSAYNSKRAEIAKIMESGAVARSGSTGTVITSELVGKDALLLNVKMSALDQMLKEMIDRMDREVKSGRLLLVRYQTAAGEAFGDKYPKLKFEDPVGSSHEI